MKNILKLAICLLPTITFAQSEEQLKESPLNITAGIQTNHLWRGLIITDKPMVSAEASLALNKAKTFTVGVWGGTSVSNEADGTHYKEINYYVKYADKGFSIGLWDLYNSRGEVSNGANDIFEYSKEKTKHILDLRTSYQLPKSLPLRLEADFLLFGSADAIYKSNGEYDRNKYSTYLEVGYPFIRNSKVNLEGFFGSAFAMDGEEGNYSLYGNGKDNFQVVNVGFKATKDVTVFNKKFPVSLTTMWNPTNKYARVQIATALF